MRIDLPEASEPAARYLLVVPVLLDDVQVVRRSRRIQARHVVDVAALLCIEADGPNRDVVAERDIDVAADVVAFLAAFRRADLDIDLARVAGEIRLVRDVADSARLRARPEQRPLRPRQHLDALDVDQSHVDLLGARGHRLIVEVYRDLAVRVVLAGARGNTAHDDVVAARDGIDQRYARQGSRDVIQGLESLLRDVLGRQGGHALRDVLQVHLAPRRGDDHGLESCSASGCSSGPGRSRRGTARRKMAAASGILRSFIETPKLQAHRVSLLPHLKRAYNKSSASAL